MQPLDFLTPCRRFHHLPGSGLFLAICLLAAELSPLAEAEEASESRFWKGPDATRENGWLRLHSMEADERFQPMALTRFEAGDEPEWVEVSFEAEVGPLGPHSIYGVELRSESSDYWYRSYRVFRPEDLQGGRFRAQFVAPGQDLDLRLAIGLQGIGDLRVRKIELRSQPVRLPEVEAVEVAPSDPPFEPIGLCQHISRVGEHTWFRTGEDVRTGIQRLKESNAQWYRTGAGFGSLFPKSSDEVSETFWRRQQLVDQVAIEAGLTPFVQVTGTSAWAAVEGEFEPWWGAPPEMKAWEEYVRFIAEHYKDSCRYFEIGNEADWKFFLGTPEQFAERFIAAAKIIKGIIPDARIMGPGLAGDGVNNVWTFHENTAEDDPSQVTLNRLSEPFFMEKILEAGIGPWLDIPTIHFYEEDAVAALDKINRFCDILDRHGMGDRPVWVTEAGYFYSSHAREGFRQRQAQFLEDLFTLVPQHPRVEKVFWWHLGGYPHAEPQRKGGRDLPFLGSLINQDYEPYAAFGTMTTLPQDQPRTVIPALRDLGPED